MEVKVRKHIQKKKCYLVSLWDLKAQEDLALKVGDQSQGMAMSTVFFKHISTTEI